MRILLPNLWQPPIVGLAGIRSDPRRWLTGVRAALGLKHLARMALNEGNDWTLPTVDLVDATVSYRTSAWDQALTVRGAVTNLADKKYWATDGWGGLRAGESRSFAVNVQLDF